MNFVDMIMFQARATPEHTAIALPDRSINYRSVGQGILSVERRLTEAGVTPNDLVGVEIDNPIKHILTACALYRLGVASVPLRSASDGPFDRLGITVMLRDRFGANPAPVRVEMVEDSWFTGPPPARAGRGFANASAPCKIMLSSGTTGQPKALVFSAADIETRLMGYGLRLSTPSWERMLCMPGLSTILGFALAITALSYGRSVSFAPSADAALQMVARHQLDMIAASPQQLQAMVELQLKRPLPCDSLVVVLVSGSYLTRSFVEQVRARLCNTVICSYGSTESGVVAYGLADHLGSMDGAVGFVTPWTQVEIVDDHDSPCPRGQEGNMRIRAEGQARSFDLPSVPPSPSGFRDGWFYPGDLARMTEDGVLVITGRTGQVINAGGLKLAPELVEELLQSHPDIADAGAAGMVGGSGIEEIWVAVVARNPLTVEAVVDYCRQRSPDMMPRQVKFVAAIPRSALGKVSREELRRLLEG